MNKIAFFITMVFLVIGINFQLFSQLPRLDMRKSSKYPGLTFWIDDSSYKSYFLDLESYGKHWDGQPNLCVILDNMEFCFNEAVTKYKKPNKELPSCLTNGLDKLINKLKSSGNTIVNCTWHKDKTLPWPFVYRQEHFDLLKAESDGGMATTAERIYLLTLWKKTYEYKFDEEKPKTVMKASNPRTVLTSSVLMHELIHCVKKHYPGCFKQLEKPENEGTTENGVVKIYTEDKSGTPYKDKYGWDYECTYENICECDCLDKKSNFF